jgi:hypothetical protein
MRKLAISLALASTALASPALARDDQWYVGVDGGAMIVEDLSLDIGTAVSSVMISAVSVSSQKFHIVVLISRRPM